MSNVQVMHYMSKQPEVLNTKRRKLEYFGYRCNKFNNLPQVIVHGKTDDRSGFGRTISKPTVLDKYGVVV